MNYFSLSLNICILFFYVFLLLIYIPKKKENNVGNRVYKGLLIINGLVLVGHFLFLLFGCYIKPMIMVTTLQYNIYAAFVLSWFCFLSHYIIVLSTEKNEKIVAFARKHKSFLKKIYGPLMAALCIISLFLPTQIVYNNIGTILEVKGLCQILWKGLSAIALITAGIIMFRNKKTADHKKINTLEILFSLGMLILILSYLIPSSCFVVLFITGANYIIYYAITNPDIVLIKELQTENGSVKKAYEIKNEFLTSLSRQLRMPLNSIVGLSQMIQSSSDVKEMHEDARDIVNASETLIELLDGILDINRIDNDKMEVIEALYVPEELLTELFKLAGNRIDGKDVQFRTNFSKDIPYELFGDRDKVKKILNNLISNAIKYTEKGYIEFSVDCTNESNVSNLTFTIKDTGIGIKEDQIPTLFTKFQHLDDVNNSLEGAGLGLAVTKYLVELLQGTIKVESVYGQGTTFTVTLKQKIMTRKDSKVPEPTAVESNQVATTTPQVEAQPVVPNQSRPTEQAQSQNYKIGNKKILVVDDNKLNLKVASKCLQAFRFEVDTVQSGFECIDRITASPNYDLIFMDIMMPKMDGVETMKKLKAMEGFKIPVIALTADAVEGSREKYLEAGFDDYVSKPIDQMTLGETLNKFVSLNVMDKEEANNFMGVDEEEAQPAPSTNDNNEEVL